MGLRGFLAAVLALSTIGSAQAAPDLKTWKSSETEIAESHGDWSTSIQALQSIDLGQIERDAPALPPAEAHLTLVRQAQELKNTTDLAERIKITLSTLSLVSKVQNIDPSKLTPLKFTAFGTGKGGMGSLLVIIGAALISGDQHLGSAAVFWLPGLLAGEALVVTAYNQAILPIRKWLIRRKLDRMRQSLFFEFIQEAFYPELTRSEFKRLFRKLKELEANDFARNLCAQALEKKVSQLPISRL